MANPFPRYKLQIFAHSALSTGVEDDVIEEDTTGDKSGIIREVICILCVNGSAEYLLALSTCVENDTTEEEDALSLLAKICHSNNAI